MSWAKIDDQLHGHRKILRAWKCRPALGLHFMAMSYAASHEPKGFIPAEWVEEKLPVARERDRAITALVDVPAGFTAGLWEQVDGGWQIHDWDEYNGSAKTREEVRAAKSEAGKKGAAVRWADKHTDGNSDGSEIAACHDAANGTGMAPFPNPIPTTASSDASDVRVVFDEWIKVTGRTSATVLSDKRRRIIRRALSDYSLADVLDAVRGWRNSPHHRGENDSRTVYNDIELLLRDSSYIEKFRDLQRGGRVRRDPTVAELQAAQQRRSAA